MDRHYLVTPIANFHRLSMIYSLYSQQHCVVLTLQKPTSDLSEQMTAFWVLYFVLLSIISSQNAYIIDSNLPIQSCDNGCIMVTYNQEIVITEGFDQYSIGIEQLIANNAHLSWNESVFDLPYNSE